ncbi:MAG: ATP-binding cassette domain-containing protein [Bacteroidales bacterium]
MEQLLEIDSVLKSFGKIRVLTDISLNCRQGDIIGLLGRNGSGKSTLLKILFGTLAADNRFIRINSKYRPQPYKEKGLINYLHQDSFLPGNLSINQIINLFLPDKTQLLLDDPLITGSSHTRIKFLSGGECRYLEIRLILESGSQFILLDEPFNGISPLMIERIKKMIQARSLDTGIILTDHDYHNVLDISNRNFLLKDGGIKMIKGRNELVQLGYLPS